MGLAAVLSLSAPAADQKSMQEHFRKLAEQKTGKGAEAEEEGKGTGSDDGSKPTAEPAKPDDDDEEVEFNAFAHRCLRQRRLHQRRSFQRQRSPRPKRRRRVRRTTC